MGPEREGAFVLVFYAELNTFFKNVLQLFVWAGKYAFL